MYQQQHFMPEGNFLEEKIKHALERYYPNYDGVSTQSMMDKLQLHFSYPLTAVEFERQIQNPHSAVSQAFFVCLMVACNEQAQQAMFHHANLLAALKDQLLNLRNHDTSHEFTYNIDQAQNNTQQLDDHLNHKHKILQQVEIQTKLLENYFKQIAQYKINHSLLSVQLRQQKQADAKQFNALVQKRGFKKLRFTPLIHAKLDQTAETLAERYGLNSNAFEYSFNQEFDNTFGPYVAQREIPKEDLETFSSYKHELRQLKLNHVRARQPIQCQLRNGTTKLAQLEQEALQLRNLLTNLGQQINYSNYDVAHRISHIHSFADQLENLKRQDQSSPYRPMGFGY